MVGGTREKPGPDTADPGLFVKYGPRRNLVQVSTNSAELSLFLCLIVALTLTDD